MPRGYSNSTGQNPFKGKKRSPFSQEHINKIRESHKGLKYPNRLKVSNEGRKNISESHIGLKYPNRKSPPPFTEERKKKLSESRKGEKNWRWIKDRTKLQKSDRNGKSPACREWRQNIWKQNNYKCVVKNQKCFGKINAHHILNWKDNPNERFLISNGITLCCFHHDEFHKKYGKRNNTKEQLEEFLEKKSNE